MTSPLRDRSQGFSGLIGVARRDITPPVGIYARQWGAAAVDVAEGVHRPLVLTAFYFRERAGGDPLILVAMDGFMFRDPKDEYAIRQPLLELFGIGPERLMLNLSHTHASCSISTSDADKPGGELIAPYLEKIRGAAMDAAREAQRTAVASVLTWEQGRCGLARNRDLRDPEAGRFVCGYNPSGTADDTVLVGRVTRDSNGGIVGTLVNYACHPTTLAWDNRLISPDFVGATREVIERETGAPAAFLQGASGELAPRRQYTGDIAVADANGRELGFAVLGVLAGMLPPRSALGYAGVRESGAPLALWELEDSAVGESLSARQGAVDLPLKPQPSEEEVLRELEQCPDRTLQERIYRKLLRIRQLGTEPICRVPFWTWRLGDAVVAAHSSEAYSLLQTELRRIFSPSPVVVMNLTNGASLSYIYPADRAESDLPLYQAEVSPFEPTALSLLIEACAESIADLKWET
ncbi:MAG: neutral/alkaline non-lysosomal ceramidase N-terminal domain-containing protein [Opitutales bacterium]